jgi:hypothetical protein
MIVGRLLTEGLPSDKPMTQQGSAGSLRCKDPWLTGVAGAYNSPKSLHGAVVLRGCGGRKDGVVTSSGSVSALAGFRFPREVIAVAVRGTCGTACRTVTSRSCWPSAAWVVDHVAVYRWVERFTLEFI